MKLSVLASGSRGNSTVVMDQHNAVLIDAGISASKIIDFFGKLSLEVTALSGLILTHEHTDHIRGAGPLARKLNIPIFCTRETWERSQHVVGKVKHVEFIETGHDFVLDNMRITPFSVPHDALNPIGLTIENQDRKVGFATDLGYATAMIRERLKGCHAILIEFNYNRDLLISGPYTWTMKQRIMSRRGHLSNEDACDLLESVIGDELRHVILAHLSENNNVPELALICARDLCQRIGKENITFTAGTPHQHSDWIVLD